MSMKTNIHPSKFENNMQFEYFTTIFTSLILAHQFAEARVNVLEASIGSIMNVIIFMHVFYNSDEEHTQGELKSSPLRAWKIFILLNWRPSDNHYHYPTAAHHLEAISLLTMITMRRC